MRDYTKIPISDEDLALARTEFETSIRSLVLMRSNHGFGTYLHRKPMSDVYQGLVDKYLPEDVGAYVSSMFSITMPEHGIHLHIDKENTRHARWHLPIYTSGTTLVEDGVPHVMHTGAWYGTVQYWLPHSVNANPEERVHMVVDFDPEA